MLQEFKFPCVLLIASKSTINLTEQQVCFYLSLILNNYCLVVLAAIYLNIYRLCQHVSFS